MPTQQPRAILAANLRRMIDSEEMSVRAWATARELDVKLINRIVNNEHAVNLETLEKIAEAVGLQPWQLLLPDLDHSAPADAPVSEEDRALLSKLRRLLGG